MDETMVAELRAELAEHTMYELLGGEDGIRALADQFYAVMDADPVYAPIREMHQADLSAIKKSLFEFLSGWLGGPPLFVMRTGSPCLTHAHAPYRIDQETSSLWMDCMTRAMDDLDMPARYREALLPAFGDIAGMLRNDPCAGQDACAH